MTRKQYRKIKENNDNLDDLDSSATQFSSDEPLSRQRLRQNKLWEDQATKQQIAEQRSKRIAHRLDTLIILLGIGILIVFLVLFFVN
ncbi:hypothetical protein MOO44_06000 [Nicoliella spurrieriana]|uniref:Uncharacterized protein n=2 Tax=Nicoliella spurrieriana TaxID=2925830 RepID=A0A976X564_9LACO|nr:hypothetical protein MOO44_06000 [Nicoliella spurrieriana]